MKSPIIKVTSPSFSRSEYLKSELKSYFPSSEFNEEGREYNLESLVSYLEGADGAIIGLDEINKEVVSRLNGIQIISKFGVGLDNIDQYACKEKGIHVGWTPGVNKRSVSELILSLMIGQCRNVYRSSNLLKDEGKWKKEGGYQLSEKTVGIVGLGNIGMDLVELIKPFRCKILANDIKDKTDYCRDNGITNTSKEDIYRNSHVITIHTPLDNETRYMINKDTLAMMRKDAYLINAARGKIVNQEDLKYALKNGIIAGAALDVYEVEPPTDREFLELPNLICTPHIGGSSKEGINAMGMSAIEHLRTYFKVN